MTMCLALMVLIRKLCSRNRAGRLTIYPSDQAGAGMSIVSSAGRIAKCPAHGCMVMTLHLRAFVNF